MKRILMIAGAMLIIFSTGTIQAQQKKLQTKQTKTTQLKSSTKKMPEFKKVNQTDVSQKVVDAVNKKYNNPKIVDSYEASNGVYKFRLEGAGQGNNVVFYKDGQLKNQAETRKMMKTKEAKRVRSVRTERDQVRSVRSERGRDKKADSRTRRRE